MAPPVPSSIPSLHAFDPQSTSWKSYRDRIQFYFEANRIVEVKEKKALFLWSVGNATYQLLENLISPRSLPDADVQFEDLLQILNTHYDDTKNIMTSTYDFYSCLQKEGQSFSEWKAELCEKLRHCGFTKSNLKDKPQDRALRDMYVIGVRNPKIRQALLKEQDPDLEKAEKIIQLAERLYEDVQHFGNPSVRVDVPVAKIQHQQPKQFFYRPSMQNNNNKNNTNNHQCATCGSTEHIRETCKYQNYTCNYCKRSGHLARVCQSRPKEEEDESSVKHVTATIFKLDHEDKVTQSPVFTTAIPLRINGHDCSFELDTGALHTIITVNDWNKIGSPIIRASNLRLKSFGGTLLEIKGECTVNVEYQRQTFTLSAIIVNESGPSLLGLPWIHHLHLDLNSIIYGNNYIPHYLHQIQGHPDLQSLLCKDSNVLNNELGHCTKVQAHIELKPNTTPRFFKPRSIPLAYLDGLKTEFDLMKPVTPLKKKPTTKYAIGDSVWALNYQSHRPHKWQQGIITKNLGSMLYEVRSSNGQYHKRHKNQLRRDYIQDNHLSDTESLPDDLVNKMPQCMANNSTKQSSPRYPRRNRKPPDRYTSS